MRLPITCFRRLLAVWWPPLLGLLVGTALLLLCQVCCGVETTRAQEFWSTVDANSLAEPWWRWYYDNHVLNLLWVIAGFVACLFIAAETSIRRLRSISGAVIFLSVLVVVLTHGLGRRCPQALFWLSGSGALSFHAMSPHGVQLVSDSMAGFAIAGVLAGAALLIVCIGTGIYWWEARAWQSWIDGAQEWVNSVRLHMLWTLDPQDGPDDTVVTYYPSDEDAPGKTWNLGESRHVTVQSMHVSQDGHNVWARRPPTSGGEDQALVSVRYAPGQHAFVVPGHRSENGTVVARPQGDLIILSEPKEVIRFGNVRFICQKPPLFSAIVAGATRATGMCMLLVFVALACASASQPLLCSASAGRGPRQGERCRDFELLDPASVTHARGYYTITLPVWLDEEIPVLRSGASESDLFDVQEWGPGGWSDNLDHYEEWPLSEMDVLFVPDISEELTDTEHCPYYLRAVFEAVLDQFNLPGGDRGAVASPGFRADNPELTSDRNDLVNRFGNAAVPPTTVDEPSLAQWLSASRPPRRRIIVLVRWYPGSSAVATALLGGEPRNEVLVVDIGGDYSSTAGPADNALRAGVDYFTVHCPTTLPGRVDTPEWKEVISDEDLAGFRDRVRALRRLLQVRYRTDRLVRADQLEPEKPDSYATTTEMVRLRTKGTACWASAKWRFSVRPMGNLSLLVWIVRLSKATASTCFLFGFLLMAPKTRTKASTRSSGSKSQGQTP